MTQHHDDAEGWYVPELLGHRKLAGYLRQTQLAGHGFLRLDIPDVGDDPGRTQLIAPGSLYALHPVSEDTARQAAAAWRPVPVQRWELPAAPVPAIAADTDDYDLDRHYDDEDPDAPEHGR